MPAPKGYSRQRAELLTRPADAFGGGWIGNGVDVSTVRRLYDTVLAGQVRSAGSGFQQLDTFSTYAGRLDNLFSDTSTGLATTLQSFINSVQAVADAPASITSRQVLLSQAGALTDRLKSYNSSLDAINNQLNSQLNSEASTISTIAGSIATLNQRIVAAQAVNQQPANDLLDQRDKLLGDLASHLSISTVTQSNGAVNVFIGNGQALVMNYAAAQLGTAGDQYAATRTRLVLQSANFATDVTDALSGGTVGGLLQFRSSMLDPSRNSVGQVAVTLAHLVNSQQAAGLDLQGQVGGDLFAVGAVRVSSSNLNAGTANASATRSDPTALTTADYQLLYDGSAWQLSRVDTGAAVAMTGTGTRRRPVRGRWPVNRGERCRPGGRPVADRTHQYRGFGHVRAAGAAGEDCRRGGAAHQQRYCQQWHCQHRCRDGDQYRCLGARRLHAQLQLSQQLAGYRCQQHYRGQRQLQLRVTDQLQWHPGCCHGHGGDRR